MKNHLNLPLLDFSDAEREAVDKLLHELGEELELLLFPIRTMLEAGVVVTEDGGMFRLDEESNKLVRLQIYPQDEGDKSRMPVDICLQVWDGDTIKMDYTISVKCGECKATIVYEPHEIESYSGTDYSGGPDGYERVKCPRRGCKGYGYIKSW